MSAENPGSFEEWSQHHTSDSREALVREYSEALQLYRHRLASESGVSEEELHRLGTEAINVGKIAVLVETQNGAGL